MNRNKRVRKIRSGLAGAVAIASGTSAYGAIVQVFPPPDLTNAPGGANTSANWDVNGDGINDFRFLNRYPNSAPDHTGVIWQLNMNPASGTELTNGLMSYAGQFVRYAFALPPGTFVGPGNSSFSTQTQVVLGSKYNYASNGSYYNGGFAAGGVNGSVEPGTFAYVGFRFAAADGTHYGWIRLRVNAGIIDFHTAVYESTPNSGLATSPLDPLTPEPGTLALLTLGAVGVIGAVIKRQRS